jgi:hypothetical protein
MAGAWLLIRCTLTALVLTAFLAGIIERMFGLPSIESPWRFLSVRWVMAGDRCLMRLVLL